MEYYIDGNIKFEGEYLNGRANGKGKEYNEEGKIILEGEYLNGELNGKGKEYYKNGKLIFEGEYLNGKRNGKGKEYNNYGKLIFEGEYLNGKKYNGWGFDEVKENNKTYKLKCGKGYDLNGNVTYELNNGNGNVKRYDYDGNLEFEGEYLKGDRINNIIIYFTMRISNFDISIYYLVNDI